MGDCSIIDQGLVGDIVSVLAVNCAVVPIAVVVVVVGPPVGIAVPFVKL